MITENKERQEELRKDFNKEAKREATKKKKPGSGWRKVQSCSDLRGLLVCGMNKVLMAPQNEIFANLGKLSSLANSWLACVKLEKDIEEMDQLKKDIEELKARRRG